MYLLKQQFFKKKGTRKYFGQSNGSANDFTGMLTAGPVLGVAFSMVFSHCQLEPPYHLLLRVSSFPSPTGWCPDQPGRGLPVWGEVDSLVQPPELQILEETEQGAQACGSHGPSPGTRKHGEQGGRRAGTTHTGSSWAC